MEALKNIKQTLQVRAYAIRTEAEADAPQALAPVAFGTRISMGACPCLLGCYPVTDGCAVWEREGNKWCAVWEREGILWILFQGRRCKARSLEIRVACNISRTEIVLRGCLTDGHLKRSILVTPRMPQLE